MKNLEKLIGKKVRGFKFEEFEHAGFTETMESFIGKKGVIESYNKNTNCFLIRFYVDNFRQWAYPADQIQAHLVEDEETIKEEIKQAIQNNKILICTSDLKVVDEIPTLSDGVMMLVSDGGKLWFERKVFGKRNGMFLVWNNPQDADVTTWTLAKPLEPTKEEQLTAILGSSEKVSEIMELFKKD